MLIKSQLEVHLHTGCSVHFHPSRCAQTLLFDFSGSDFETSRRYFRVGGLKRKGNPGGMPPQRWSLKPFWIKMPLEFQCCSFTCIFFCVQGFVHLSHSKNNFTSSAIFWSSLSCMPVMYVTHYKLQAMLESRLKCS